MWISDIWNEMMEKGMASLTIDDGIGPNSLQMS